MKAPPFDYHHPQSTDELLGLLASLENAKLLAGGQSLMPMLNLRLVAPDHVIDINHLPGFAGIRISGDTVEIGAMTRQAEVLASDELAAVAPVFRAALAHVGHLQTRSRGTIGGSCCHLDPAAEQPALCALLDAEFDVLGPDGARMVAARDWFQRPLQSALGEREVLRAIRFKAWPRRHGAGFSEFARRRGDFATAGAAALLARDGAGAITRAAIVVFGVEGAPARLSGIEDALVGRKPEPAMLEEAAEAARALAPMEDIHITAAYRSHLAGVVTMRALAMAAGLEERAS